MRVEVVIVVGACRCKEWRWVLLTSSWLCRQNVALPAFRRFITKSGGSFVLGRTTRWCQKATRPWWGTLTQLALSTLRLCPITKLHSTALDGRMAIKNLTCNVTTAVPLGRILGFSRQEICTKETLHEYIRSFGQIYRSYC